jgi:hypothetical protein
MIGDDLSRIWDFKGGICMKKILVISMLALIISACSTINDKKSALELGMTKERVVTLLGKPVEGEKYCGDNLLFYYEGAKWFDGNITSDECFPLVFEEGKLVGWGQNFYQSYRKKIW